MKCVDKFRTRHFTDIVRSTSCDQVLWSVHNNSSRYWHRATNRLSSSVVTSSWQLVTSFINWRCATSSSVCMKCGKKSWARHVTNTVRLIARDQMWWQVRDNWSRPLLTDTVQAIARYEVWWQLQNSPCYWHPEANSGSSTVVTSSWQLVTSFIHWHQATNSSVWRVVGFSLTLSSQD